MRKSERYNTRSLYFSELITNAMRQIPDYPLTIVEAPMGYGKTTAVREQLNFYKANVMWQRVYENSISTFWNGFCHLFSGFAEEQSQSLLLLQFPNDSVSLGKALNIIERIELPAKSVIVIDDYHLTECAEINCFIEFLVMSEITDVHIVLTTRYTYFPRLEELLLKGYLYHIKQESFELTPMDIMSYYKQCGKRLNADDARKLYSLTEGWISALYLLMLNYGTEGSSLHLADIHKLIDKIVYRPLPEIVRDLLINMSIFNSFTFEQAGYIWKRDNPVAHIAVLVEKNAFVTYDSREKTYHIHSVLKSFLREQLDNKEKSYKEALYNKAADWYRGIGEYLVSMSYAYLAGDFNALLQAIEIDKGQSFNYDCKELFIKYFEECPTESKQKFPYAMIILARRMFTFNETDLFKKICAEFVTNMRDMDGLNVDYKNRLLGEYELLLSFTGYNDIGKMSEYHRRACSLLESPSSILDGKGSWTFGSPSVLYMFYRKSGELESEVQIIREAMPFYYQATNDHGKGAEKVMEAEHYYYLGDFENSEIVMHNALQTANETSQAGIRICAVFLQIKLAFMKGDFPSILHLFKKMRADINDKKWYLFMHTLDMCEAYIYSCLNIKNHIQSWVKNGEFGNTRLLFPAMAFLNIVYGRVLLINGEYLKIIGSTEGFIEIASFFPNLLGQIHTYIYHAAANYKISRQNEALDTLKKALDIAMPDKVYMPFVENCDYILPLLEELQPQGSYREGIARILELFEPYKKAVGHIRKEYFEEGKPVLTKREMEIANLAAEGLSNKEIGERLYISQNTVKTQLKSIFEKLGINSRVLLRQSLFALCCFF
ncbi:LuxR C-terminal-related transcriptional regulator [Desulfosporosinus sp. OT]|uniref:helix-turn-helix transcriptional regulator n=1 Tax=Desulfosporosinus sp. OT TaxID=913865 RepID=UPI0002239C1C|nr:LuxR C-terminal-related transcriptional regulator [Desulfosporosinus sp. OT]EGW36041.1 bacterial regulatory s, luxR family protein [Desulfosporosinus sp. OT]